MFKDYHYLNRCIIELDSELRGSRIIDIFSQEKNKLFLTIPSPEFPDRHLIISTNPQFPFLLVKNKHHRAKKNTVAFFKQILDDTIEKVEITPEDRVVRFTLSCSKFYYIIKGSKSNILQFSETGSVISFKKNRLSDDELHQIRSYIFNAQKNLIPHFYETQFDNYKEFKRLFPQLSRFLYNELIYRNSMDTKAELDKCINEIFDETIVLVENKYDGKLVFCPSIFHIESSIVKGTFENYNDALNKYISIFHQGKRQLDIRKEIEKFVDKEKQRLSNKLNNLKGRIEKGSRESEYYKFGSLLLNNIYKIEKGWTEIDVEDYETDEEVKIKLNPKNSPQQNIDNYFEKAKDEKKNYLKSKELFNLTKKKFDDYSEISNTLKTIAGLSELVELKKKLRIEKNKGSKLKVEENVNLREYILDNKYTVWVGKDSKSNDLLSTKIAKQNDYWFHARGLPGSHVVLRVDNPKEGVPKNILNNAASIAAFYSKAKTAKMAPVSYTLRKYVRKKKGMEPGKVLLSKEKVLIVKPEIPKNCESVID